MKTVFVVFENSWRGKFISSIFQNEPEAKAYMYEIRGEDYDLDSAYQYFMQEWELK